MVLPNKTTYKSLIRFLRPIIFSTPYHLTKFTQGQALIEIMIALGMALLIITGFMSVMNTGLTSSTFATEKVQSVSIAKEGLERVRWFRDEQGWGDNSSDYLYKRLKNSCGGAVGCTDTTLFSGTSYNTVPSNPFTREYIASEINPSEMKVQVVVKWPTRNGTSTTDLYTIVTNWRYP